ncbi:hypothetical protein [Paenibacillus sp. FJAT-27812]|uniref:hypothetical protein n=1 Tax=Paenibacillus sp. FJAT-27812 TaxID=1684143 RepID=UPI0006A78356|nr:hypothetical protein [Paenibacillus sp. FJAT-27812]
MQSFTANEDQELVLSRQADSLWKRRTLELNDWVERDKRKKRDKATLMLGSNAVDAELYPALAKLSLLDIPTEFSCAGVSMLDDPLEHSLYAYITFQASEQLEPFVRFAIKFMRHRLLVIFEPARGRYDLSSFFIGHNRSFCFLMQRCAEAFEEQHRV